MPLWITIRDDLLPEKDILITIKNRYLRNSDVEVVLLFDDIMLDDERKEILYNWCIYYNWKMIDFMNMTGSEGSVVILYKICNYIIEHLEYFSRAKSHLIIVQR